MGRNQGPSRETPRRDRVLQFRGMEPNLAEYYDAVINWEKRLAREMPLLEELARAAGAHVLVPACGTGGHVVALAERGFKTLGFDADEAALKIAQRKINSAEASIAAAGGEARLVHFKMEDAGQLGPHYDAAFCLGNALPGLSEPGQLLAALRGVAGTLRPGGWFFTQNLNYDLRWREKAKLFPVLSGETPEEEVLLVKFADYEAEFINFHALFLARPKAGGGWQSLVRSSRQIPLFRERLSELLRQAGFGNLQSWGDYAETPFDAERSADLLVLAERSQ
jgi:SAM-dependent methyltransferase